MKDILFEENGECFDCISHRRGQFGNGYPEIKIDGKMVSVAKYLWEKDFGTIPPDKILHNTCGNKKCINLNHWKVATRSDAMQKYALKGSAMPNSILTEEDVIQIRNSPYGYKRLSRIYGVHMSTIRSIKLGTRWKHVPGGGRKEIYL